MWPPSCAGLSEQATLSLVPTKPDVRVFQVRQIGLKEEGIDLEVMTTIEGRGAVPGKAA